MFYWGRTKHCTDSSPVPTDAPHAALLRALKVLVVDDEQSMRKVVRTLLAGIGVGVTIEAIDGADGIEQIRRNAPDLVIVDWQMPNLDGPGFIRQVRSAENCPYPQVPIIILTGHSRRERVVEAIEIGANDFLLKPVSSKALEERLLAVLNPAAGQGGEPDARQRARDIHADGDEAVTVVMLDS